jgi:hypothetical protein
VWERLATWLAFLAVAAALWAPVSMLAQDVRTGKLGGICSVNTFDVSSADSNAPADGDAAQSGMRCDLCGSLALVLPALPEAAVACFRRQRGGGRRLPHGQQRRHTRAAFQPRASRTLN